MPGPLLFLAEVALRSSLVIAAAWLALAALRRASAAHRHLAVLLALLVVLVLPVAVLLGPEISCRIPLPVPAFTPEISHLMVPDAMHPQPALDASMLPVPVSSESPTPRAWTIGDLVIALLFAGMVLQVSLLLPEMLRWRRLRSRSEPAKLSPDLLARLLDFTGTRRLPPILVSAEISRPLLLGWHRPAVLLPSEMRQGCDTQMEMALLHELAHYRRGDSRALPLLAMLRVLYWWHPLVWMARARLLRERERACDDLVLQRHIRASDYAALIIDVARRAGRGFAPEGAIAMATPSRLGERIEAVLHPALRRTAPGRWCILGCIFLALAFGLLFSTVRLEAGTRSATAQPAVNAPQIELRFQLFEFDASTYAARKGQIDVALASGDVAFLEHLEGVSMLSMPSVTTRSGTPVTDDVVREMPYATAYDRDANGKPVPSKFATRELGPKIEATPTLAADQKTIEMHLKCSIESFEGFLKIEPGVEQPVFNARRIETQRLFLTNTYFWVGVTPNDTATKRTALLVFAHLVSKPKGPVTAPSTPGNSKPKLRFAIDVFEIDEKTYQSQRTALDSAVRDGNLALLEGKSDGVAQSHNQIAVVRGEPGWFSLGQVVSYIAFAEKKTDPGAKSTYVLTAKAIFYGLNVDLNFTKDGALNTYTQVTVLTGLDKFIFPADIPRRDQADLQRNGPLLVPKVSVITHVDPGWAITTGRRHGFWAGDSRGWVNLINRANIDDNGLQKLLKLEKPTRLAIFLTAQPAGD